MFGRILIFAFFVCCGINTASAGIITSADSANLDSAVGMDSTSAPAQPSDAPAFRSMQEESGMSSASSSHSSTSPQATLDFSELDFPVWPNLSQSRLRLANASLPSSPVLDGLLKPS